MSRDIFRKEALERLYSPEQLDRLMPITNPRGWLALAGIGLFLLAAILWGFFGSIPLTVEGHGALVRLETEDVVEKPHLPLMALFYFPPEEGCQIHPGMAAEVLPITGNVHQSIRVAGLVHSVVPSSDDPLSIMVTVDLADSPPGVGVGTPCEVKVIIKKLTPIHLVLPWSGH